MLKIINTKIILSFALLLIGAVLIVGATTAFFSDTEQSNDNNFTAGSIDLKIDNTSYYNGVANADTTWTLNDLTNQLFFNFADIKPGDYGEDTISLHAENDYWLCAKLTMTANDDLSCTEPELLDDNACSENEDLFDGELAQNLNFVFWKDDGDNVFEEDEQDGIIIQGSGADVLNANLALADSQNGTPIPGTQTYYVGKVWCFGELTKSPLPQGDYPGPDVDNNNSQTVTVADGGFNCDGASLNNATQTDKVLADIAFDAVQARHNPDFLCPTPPPSFDCGEDHIIYASLFDANDQGLRKDGTAVLADRSDPSAAYGVPQTTGTPYDSVINGSFFSLGFPYVGSSTKTASIVFGFSEPFYNGPGDDLQVFEVTGGSNYPDEKVKVEVSMSPTGPWTLLSAISIRDASLDLGSMTMAQYVRLTDVSNINSFESTADGYDVDAIKAFCTEIE